MSDTSFNGLAGLSGSLLGFSIIAVSLRFYVRYRQDKSFKTDDWLMIPALVSLEDSSACPGRTYALTRDDLDIVRRFECAIILRYEYE